MGPPAEWPAGHPTVPRCAWRKRRRPRARGEDGLTQSLMRVTKKQRAQRLKAAVSAGRRWPACGRPLGGG